MPPQEGDELIRDILSTTRLCVAALRRSLSQVEQLFPLTPERLSDIDLDTADLLAAFLKRFENLVEISHRQLFRAALVLGGEEHQHESARQIRDRLGRLEILADPDEWKKVMDARHRTAHVYPLGDVRAAAALNDAFAMAHRAMGLIAPMPAELERRFPHIIGSSVP